MECIGVCCDVEYSVLSVDCCVRGMRPICCESLCWWMYVRGDKCTEVPHLTDLFLGGGAILVKLDYKQSSVTSVVPGKVATATPNNTSSTTHIDLIE